LYLITHRKRANTEQNLFFSVHHGTIDSEPGFLKRVFIAGFKGRGSANDISNSPSSSPTTLAWNLFIFQTHNLTAQLANLTGLASNADLSS
jgi:hypothetical protein